MTSSDRSQSIECLRSSPTIQDGVGQIIKKIDTERQLADKIRSKRCLLDNGSAPLPSETSQIPNVAIYGSPI